MIVQVFSIYDTVAGSYNRPFYTHNIAMAIRDVVKSLKRDADFRENAGDSILYHLGSYDDSTGTFTNLANPVSLGVVAEWLPVAQQPQEASLAKSNPHSAA